MIPRSNSWPQSFPLRDQSIFGGEYQGTDKPKCLRQHDARAGGGVNVVTDEDSNYRGACSGGNGNLQHFVEAIRPQCAMLPGVTSMATTRMIPTT
jgi:hypothetical protein